MFLDQYDKLPKEMGIHTEPIKLVCDAQYYIRKKEHYPMSC